MQSLQFEDLIPGVLWVLAGITLKQKILGKLVAVLKQNILSKSNLFQRGTITLMAEKNAKIQ